MFEDKTLVCRECGAEFVFTASEQQFYAEKGLPERARPLPGLPCRPSPEQWRRSWRASDVRCDLRWLRPAHAGALPAARRPSGLLPCLLRGAVVQGRF